jgi:ribosome-binding protein aMBF1 (putative translation factor)
MTIPFKTIKDAWMKDPTFRAEYDALTPQFTMIATLIRARARAGLTQAQLARRMGTKQSVVARIESGRNPPNFRTLEKYARALGRRIELRLVSAA